MEDPELRRAQLGAGSWEGRSAAAPRSRAQVAMAGDRGRATAQRCPGVLSAWPGTRIEIAKGLGAVW